MGPRHPAPFRPARLPRSREIDLQPLKRSPRAAATSEGGNRAKFVQNSFPWREQRRDAKSGRHHRALSRLSTRGAVAGSPRVYADHHPKFVHGRDENSFRSRSRTRDLIAHRKNHTLYIFGCYSEAISSTVSSVGFFSDSRLSSRGFESRQCDTHLISASLQAPENWTVVLHDELRRATATCLAAQQSDSPNLASPQAPKNGLSCRRPIAQIWRHSKRPKMDCRTSNATAQIWRQSKRPKMDCWQV